MSTQGYLRRRSRKPYWHQDRLIIETMNATRSARRTNDETAPDVMALEDAFAQYESELIGTLYYMVGNIDDARDALQETFLKCWRNQEKLPEIRQLKAWIFRIALNTARDLRQTAWRRKRNDLPNEELVPTKSDERPEVLLSKREEMNQLREAIGQLRDEEKEVFLLRENGQMTYEEIGESLGIPTGTVKTRMRLAVTKLRSVVAPSNPQ
jgi:RNA polymerase sigma factor (sigma-70 family)